MAQTFARWLGGVDDLPAGMFTLATFTGRAALACSVCGERFDLPRGVGVDQVGRTSVAVQCPRAACPFWDWCLLDGHWEPRP